MKNLKFTIFEPKQRLPLSRQLFSNQDLFSLIYPLFIEQVLLLGVGISDTLMISYAGESAVSGVSLVNQINTVFLGIFVALAAGGSVVISQYLGRQDQKRGIQACNQLFLVALFFSVFVMTLILLLHRPLLRFLYPNVSLEIMKACQTYLFILALSFPASALYNACSAILRSLAKTKAIMVVSLGMNAFNIIGNALGIFYFKAGVAGVAIPSLVSQILAALVMVKICTSKDQAVYLDFHKIGFRLNIFRQIFKVALPNAAENGLLDGLKVGLSSIVALFGTSQIAANGVAQTFWSFAAVFLRVMGPVFIAVVGRCIGAKDDEAADYYIRKLLRITFLGCLIWNALTFLMVPFALKLYHLNQETIQLIIVLCLIHNIANVLLQPEGFILANGLRAAGDVKFALAVAIIASVMRLALAYLFGVIFRLGVIGVTFAMICDWAIRAFLISGRYLSGKWKNFQVI